MGQFITSKKFLTGRTTALLLCLFILLCRLPVITSMGLTGTEAYYWTWSKNLDLSYVDGPPAIAYMIRLGTSIFGDTPFGVRVVPTILTTASLMLTYFAGELIGGPVAGLATMITFLCKPIFLVGGVMAAPDTPYAFFLIIALCFFIKSRKTEKARRDASEKSDIKIGLGHHDLYIVLTGLFLGLAFLSKYPAIAFLPGIALTMLLANNRHWWKRPSLYACIGFALAATIPVIIWHLHRERNLIPATIDSYIAPSLTGTGAHVSYHLSYFSPFILAGYIFAFVRAWRSRKSDHIPFEIMLIGLPGLILYYTSLIINPGIEPHWALGGYIYMSVVLGWSMSTAAIPVKYYSEKSRWKKWWSRWTRPMQWMIGSTLVFSLFVMIFAYIFTMTPVLMKYTPKSMKKNVEMVNSLYGWDVFKEHVDAIYSKTDSRPFLLSYNHKLCAHMMFAMGGRIEVQCISHETSEFDFFPGNGENIVGRDAIYVRSNVYDKYPRDLYFFDSCQSVDKFSIERGDTKIGDFELFLCRGYRGEKPKHVNQEADSGNWYNMCIPNLKEVHQCPAV